ncbi:MAG: rod shape-determining protein MreD [Paracoccaceae bacterium]
MKHRVTTSIWFQRLLFLAAGGFAILTLLLPLGLSADRRPMPDLVFALCACWVVRRPLAAPFLLVGAVGLMADILLGGPVGLGALLLMWGTEAMRQNIRSIREYPFVFEFLWFAGLFALVLLARSILLAVAFAPNVQIVDMARYYITTLVSYPVVAAVVHWGLRVRFPRTRPVAVGLGRSA